MWNEVIESRFEKEYLPFRGVVSIGITPREVFQGKRNELVRYSSWTLGNSDPSCREVERRSTDLPVGCMADRLAPTLDVC